MPEKNNYVHVTLPAGTAYWCHTHEKDMRFAKGDPKKGKYKAAVVLPRVEVEDLLEQLHELAQEAYDNAKAEAKGKVAALFKNKEVDLKYGYEVEYDEDGSETGNVILTAKSENRPVMVDAKKNKINKPVAVHKGDTIRIAVAIGQYFSPGFKCAGTTLYLNAVQIIEKTSGGAAGSYGFDEEDGYAYDEADAYEAGDEGDQQGEEEPNGDFE